MCVVLTPLGSGHRVVRPAKPIAAGLGRWLSRTRAHVFSHLLTQLYCLLAVVAVAAATGAELGLSVLIFAITGLVLIFAIMVFVRIFAKMVVMLIFATIGFVLIFATMGLVLIFAIMGSVRPFAALVAVVARIFCVDVMNVGVVVPAYGAIETAGFLIELPLGRGEQRLHVLVAIFPSCGLDVAIAGYAIEVGKVELQDAVALAGSEGQLKGHLVGYVLCFTTNVQQSLCAC